MDRLGIDEIKKILPHREPFLLIDEAVSVEPGVKAVALHHVAADEFWVRGHFPSEPVMPGVLIVEALAQTGGLAVLCMEEHRGKIAYFGAIDRVKFRGKVVPGDELRLEVELDALKSRGGRGIGRAYVGDKMVCSCELTFMFGT